MPAPPNPLAPPAPPTNPYEAYVPDADNPYDNRRLGHLLRRTACGLTPERLDRFAGKSPSDVLDWLFNFDPNADPLAREFRDFDSYEGSYAKPEDAQKWWTFRFFKIAGEFHTHPFQERVALFWHNHFATSLGKGDAAMAHRMHNQIGLFRRLGLANFKDLLTQVGRDPAMLVWLDGQYNRKGKPNENYGRELQELFTLGIGNYSETDVKEVARAYTGWRIKGDQSVLDAKAFDDGEKTIYGKTGKFNDEAVVDLILNHPACPRHIAWKMLREFLHPNPPADVIAHYAQRLVDNKWEIKPVLREILSSRLFFSDWAYRAKIKGPCELVVGTMLAIAGLSPPPADPDDAPMPMADYAFKAMASMGQPIMEPPSVKGWDGEEAWINANTLFIRYNFASAAAQQTGKEYTRKSDIKEFLEKRELTSAEKIVDYFASILLDGNPPPALRDKLLDFMKLTVKGKPAPFVFNADTVHTKVRDVLHVMMATPEYQLA